MVFLILRVAMPEAAKLLRKLFLKIHNMITLSRYQSKGGLIKSYTLLNSQSKDAGSEMGKVRFILSYEDVRKM